MKKSVFILATVVVFNYGCKKDQLIAPQVSSESIDSEVPEGFVKIDDMILSEELFQALTNKKHGVDKGTAVLPDHRWPDGVIPYWINTTSTSIRNRVNEAIQTYHDKTNIRFVEWTAEDDYIEFTNSTSGCSSNVGRINSGGSGQRISLSPFCSVGAVKHEIGHALGMFHEHQRTDQTSHVQIIYSSIDTNKLPTSQHQINFAPFNTVAGFPDGTNHGVFDFSSIMMYSPSAFAKTGMYSIVDLNGYGSWSSSSVLSTGDLQAISYMYPAADFKLNSKGNTSGDLIGETFVVGHHAGDSRDDVFDIASSGAVYSRIANGPTNLTGLSAPVLMPGTNVGSPSTTQYFAADFSGDGKTDLMTLSSTGVLKYYQLTHYYYTYLEDKGVVNGFSGNAGTQLFVEDWDQDGKPDIMARNGNDFTLYHSFNHYNQTFVSASAGTISEASGYIKIISGEFSAADGEGPSLIGIDILEERGYQHWRLPNGEFGTFRWPTLKDFDFLDIREIHVAKWAGGVNDDLFVITHDNELLYYEFWKPDPGSGIFARKWAPVEGSGWTHPNNKHIIGNFSNNGTPDIIRDQHDYDYFNYFEWEKN